MRPAAGRFRQRFMLLSLALHVGPLFASSFLNRPDDDPSPPVSEMPIGISLVFVDANPTSAADQTEPVDRRYGSETGTDQRPEPDQGDRNPLPDLVEVAAVGTVEPILTEPDTAEPDVVDGAQAAASGSAVRVAELSPRSTSPTQSIRQPAEPPVTVTTARSRRPTGRSQVGAGDLHTSHDSRVFVAGALVYVGAEASDSADGPRLHTEAEALESETATDDQVRRDRQAEEGRSLANAAVETLSQRVSRTQRQPSRRRPEPYLLAAASPGLATSPTTNARGSQRAQQDRVEAIRRIRDRIYRIMPLVYWRTSRVDEEASRAVVRFRLNRGGYVVGYEILTSSGDLEVDHASRTVLHMAEPYVFVPGWIELALVFRG